MELTPDQRVYASFFTGPNGFGAGLKYTGWRPADCIEFDDACCETIKANYEGVKIHNKDIRKQLVRDLTRRYYVLITYTWPCNTYANIGNIHGNQTGDDLFLHAIRNHLMLLPEIAIFENVLGMRKFPVVMELLREYPEYEHTEFTVYGHDFTMQQKVRCFVILHRQPYTFRSLENFPLETISIPGYIPAAPGRKLRDYLDPPGTPFEVLPSFKKRVEHCYGRDAVLSHPDQTIPIQLQTNLKRDRSGHLVYDEEMGEYRAWTVDELLRLHGFPTGYVICGKGKNARYKQVIDSVMPPVAYVLGMMVNEYLDAIQELVPQPEKRKHRFVQSKDPRRRAEDEQSEYTYRPPAVVEPINGAKQLTLDLAAYSA